MNMADIFARVASETASLPRCSPCSTCCSLNHAMPRPTARPPTAAAAPWITAASSIWSWLDAAAGRRGAARVLRDVEKAPAAEIDRAAMETRIFGVSEVFLRPEALQDALD